MAEDNETDVWFQTFYIRFKHPETGEEIERVFAGQALLTPEEIKRFGDRPVEDIIIEASFDHPYNPYMDEDNPRGQDKVVQAIRESIKRTEK